MDGKLDKIDERLRDRFDKIENILLQLINK